jgi:hypothetical protein
LQTKVVVTMATVQEGPSKGEETMRQKEWQMDGWA